MPLPTIAGTVRCSFQGTLPSGRQWVNVIHARYSAGASSPGPAEISALDALLVRLWAGAAFSTGAPWFQNCGNDVKLVQATYYVLNATSVSQIISHTASGALSAGGNLPSEAAHVLTLRTPNRGRRYRGRLYLPCGSVTAIPNGVLPAAFITATIAQLNGLQAALKPIQWELGVASYGVSWNRGPHNAHGAATKTTWAPFFTALGDAPTLCTMDSKVDVVRRRKG